LSFRGTLRAEESLILLNLKPGKIPRFARNDKIIYFFRSLFSLSGFRGAGVSPAAFASHGIQKNRRRDAGATTRTALLVALLPDFL